MPSLDVLPGVMPVLDLGTLGFFTSTQGQLGNDGPSDVASIVSFTCPTNKIRRVIACHIEAPVAMTTCHIGLIHPAAAPTPVLIFFSGSITAGVVDRDFLWPPGAIIQFQGNFGVANVVTGRLFYFEEEAGISPTK